MEPIHAGTKQPSNKTKNVAALTFSMMAALAFVAALVVPSATLAKKPPTIQADNPFASLADDEIRTFTVDVSQSPPTNAQNDVDPAEGQVLFTRGDTYIVDGNIYREGTIQRGIFDPDPNTPVIGKYRLRGTFTSDTADFTRAIAGDPSAPQIIAFSTESFSLPDDGTTILTDGIWPNARKALYRVVLGGTGRFRGVVGEIYEDNIGEGKLGFCNSRVTFRIRKAAIRHER